MCFVVVFFVYWCFVVGVGDDCVEGGVYVDVDLIVVGVFD